MLGRDDSRELTDFPKFPTQLVLGRDDSREVNRFSAVSDLVSDGEG